MDIGGDNLVSYKEFKDYFIQTQGLAMVIERIRSLFKKILKRDRVDISNEKLTYKQLISFFKQEIV